VTKISESLGKFSLREHRRFGGCARHLVSPQAARVTRAGYFFSDTRAATAFSRSTERWKTGCNDRSPDRTTADRGPPRLGPCQIDADHFAIAALWRDVDGCAPIAVPFQIARLRKRMRRHFEDEAELIEAAGTPFCACHHEEHESMLRLCDQAYLLSDSNGRGARALLRATLPRLMRRHIVGMDQIAVLIIHSAVGRHAILESEPLEPA